VVCEMNRRREQRCWPSSSYIGRMITESESENMTTDFRFQTDLRRIRVLGPKGDPLFFSMALEIARAHRGRHRTVVGWAGLWRSVPSVGVVTDPPSSQRPT
jgi:hypothetical protein